MRDGVIDTVKLGVALADGVLLGVKETVREGVLLGVKDGVKDALGVFDGVKEGVFDPPPPAATLTMKAIAPVPQEPVHVTLGAGLLSGLLS